MNFSFLIAAAFFAGFGLGYAKFFALNYLSDVVYQPDDRVWIIQAVGAVITLGPFLVYVLSAPLAASSYKATMMRRAAAGVALLLFLGIVLDWPGSAWPYIFLIGAIMGMFNSAKGACVPLESAQSGRPTELVAALLSIVYIAGILAGAPIATEAFQRNAHLGAACGVFIFLIAAISGGLCSYEREAAHLKAFGPSFRDLLKDTAFLVRRYWIYLGASPMIWGIASAASLAVTSYAEARLLGTAVQCSLMAAWATIGVIAGNALSVRLRHIRYRAASVSAVLFVVLLISIPVIVEFASPSPRVEENGWIYLMVATDLALVGMLFGITTNLIEAEYYSLVYADGKEGTGAALLSAMTAFFPFLLGGLIALAVIHNLASALTQFAWIAVLTAIPAGLIIYLGLQKRRG